MLCRSRCAGVRDLAGLAGAFPATLLVIVRDPGQDPEEVFWQARKIGYERLAGELTGGLASWTTAGHRVASTRMTTPAAADPTAVIDVRQAAEFAPGHLPGAVNIELGALSRSCADLPGTAASVLERAGVSDVTILPGGPQDWADAGLGRTLQSNP